MIFVPTPIVLSAALTSNFSPKIFCLETGIDKSTSIVFLSRSSAIELDTKLPIVIKVNMMDTMVGAPISASRCIEWQIASHTIEF